ncbi:Mini-ribonuclease 3 [Isachenkonia alkalipeptolytica]|uniref:Mini-ribonuclease 3 n=1 Tax=Isachenkonia alkalipeptolytica TaxID=2565777 RepID=A0AA44BG21_9CLOT|nr:ribonuclease III domain-containing protein [Isachenkonia alkalipeptolytica]NBG89036.1 Mini-ribonuclease 3 [Isachenkonia alkalipeptolytica]
MEEFLEKFKESKTTIDVKQTSPLALAYVGDAVYEVYIRKVLIENPDLSVDKLHKRAVKYVRAKAQADIVLALEPELTEEEWVIVKKGRNQKSKTVPKNSDIGDYRYATGFEALIGFLFCQERHERLMEVMKRAVEIILEEEK